ncbi:MAG TPA: hypothetical protein VE978_14670 [Chitinophagales bacterium]|nr:hypothetical protein [Chitinophagales bacterium]
MITLSLLLLLRSLIRSHYPALYERLKRFSVTLLNAGSEASQQSDEQIELPHQAYSLTASATRLRILFSRFFLRLN